MNPISSRAIPTDHAQIGKLCEKTSQEILADSLRFPILQRADGRTENKVSYRVASLQKKRSTSKMKMIKCDYL